MHQTSTAGSMRYEIAFTIVDFLAASLFVIGSILFFNEPTVYAGTWLFLIGVYFLVSSRPSAWRENGTCYVSEVDKAGDRARCRRPSPELCAQPTCIDRPASGCGSELTLDQVAKLSLSGYYRCARFYWFFSQPPHSLLQQYHSCCSRWPFGNQPVSGRVRWHICGDTIFSKKFSALEAMRFSILQPQGAGWDCAGNVLD